MASLVDDVARAVLRLSHSLKELNLGEPVSISLDPESFRAVFTDPEARKYMVSKSGRSGLFMSLAGVEIKEAAVSEDELKS